MYKCIHTRTHTHTHTYRAPGGERATHFVPDRVTGEFVVVNGRAVLFAVEPNEKGLAAVNFGEDGHIAHAFYQLPPASSAHSVD